MNADNWSSASAAAFNLFSTAFTLTSDLCLPGLTIASLSSSVKSWIMLRMRRSVPLWVSSENASLYCHSRGKDKIKINEIMWIICEGSVIIPLEYDIRCRVRSEYAWQSMRKNCNTELGMPYLVECKSDLCGDELLFKALWELSLVIFGLVNSK